MSNTVEVNIEYIDRYDRKPEDPKKPAYENKINEILNFYSEMHNKIWDTVPRAAKRAEAIFDPQWTPHSLALEETISNFSLPLNYDETEFIINTETLEITSPY